MLSCKIDKWRFLGISSPDDSDSSTTLPLQIDLKKIYKDIEKTNKKIEQLATQNELKIKQKLKVGMRVGYSQDARQIESPNNLKTLYRT